MDDDNIDKPKRVLSVLAGIAVKGIFYGGFFLACFGFTIMLFDTISERFHPETVWEMIELTIGYGFAAAMIGFGWYVFYNLFRDEVRKWRR